jgi:hypothetical protein
MRAHVRCQLIGRCVLDAESETFVRLEVEKSIAEDRKADQEAKRWMVILQGARNSFRSGKHSLVVRSRVPTACM